MIFFPIQSLHPKSTFSRDALLTLYNMSYQYEIAVCVCGGGGGGGEGGACVRAFVCDIVLHFCLGLASVKENS